ncbi:MAG: hypothetical protein D6719_03550 [Candidatus Dadabacteria bacterium]|nr:MAG: hypothetical protein D6719_03550 [Candidatus Dadabacteria bacterium]
MRGTNFIPSYWFTIPFSAPGLLARQSNVKVLGNHYKDPTVLEPLWCLSVLFKRIVIIDQNLELFFSKIFTIIERVYHPFKFRIVSTTAATTGKKRANQQGVAPPDWCQAAPRLVPGSPPTGARQLLPLTVPGFEPGSVF